MTKGILMLCLGHLMVASLAMAAEEYSECRERCTQQYTDCLNEPRASEPDVQIAKEGACTQRLSLCYAECEKLKRANEEMQSGYNSQKK